MIPLHTSHGWIAPSLRTGNAWSAIQFFGGLAAPLFLSLAGVSLGLRWAARAARGERPRHRDDVARALQLIVLGYAMRLQMWIIDGGAYARPETYVALLLLCGGYALAYVACGKLAREPRRGLYGIAAAALVSGLGLFTVSHVAPTRVYGLVRVDVLQCIGGSLALLSLLGAARGPRFSQTALYVWLGIGAAFFASWTRGWVPGPLPEPLAAYFGQWEPPTGRSVLALFPLFPWVAYAAIGVALGMTWARAAASGRIETLVLGMTALGACLALGTSEAQPHVFLALPYMPWLTQPVRVAYRVGLVMVLAGAALGIVRTRLPLRAALDTLGRASLLVYWVHLEFAFGAAATPLSKKLGYGAWAMLSALLVLAMLLVAELRLRLPAFRARRALEQRGAPLAQR